MKNKRPYSPLQHTRQPHVRNFGWHALIWVIGALIFGIGLGLAIVELVKWGEW